MILYKLIYKIWEGKEMRAIKLLLISVFTISVILGCAQSTTDNGEKNKNEYNELTLKEKLVIIHKVTEPAFTGKYDKHFEKGTYVCKQCGAELYRSVDKFDSGCGWPAFDDEIEGAVKRVPDGFRTEIICANCDGHLGHVFVGEGFTQKNTRHCVNSISMDFIPSASRDTAYFAGGCFWGVEYYFEKADGVESVVSGYMGGKKKNPTYLEVSSKKSGHAEVVQVIFDPQKVSYQALAKLFFEIHDPTQVNRQGPDVGKQYRSEIFFTNKEQKQTVKNLIEILVSKGYNVATQITRAGDFWKAEDYHQDYYANKGGTPYCHSYTKRF